MSSQLALEPIPASLLPPAGNMLRIGAPGRAPEPTYYGLPMLKKPLWSWEIALYFFGEGISSGCFVLATAAEFFGGKDYARFIRVARFVSFATMIPCPPLLIADLGRPERFLHMLRVFKPSSPMNLGAWALTGFGVPVTILALAHAPGLVPRPFRLLLRRAPAKWLVLLGLGPAFIMMSYPGVLLATTSTPIWTRTRALGALLASSSMVTSAAALALASAIHPFMDDFAREAMRKIETAAHICETGALAAYLLETGRAADPIVRGSQARNFWYGAVGCGLVLPWLIHRAKGKKPRRAATIVSALLTLAGGLALKWSIVHAGHESALDGDANRRATAASPRNPGWRPSLS
ncbi:MAG TPA: NrfD/PsrC family molybdoenzyme membrane anchor subunit [Bryobacteraceae bacterium]|nr:NrfD/PsrC family molybdoenzyme membrane anchor subunit [Bryobacteraceae bacterium]